ncbi:hypothetical protein L6Q96_13310 [Candidatus Binatia bacterium]|nr:hypothetical protein [Candidatus Binatia bacterium]
MREWHWVWTVLLLWGALMFAPACASRQPEPKPFRTPQSIERPAKSLTDESSTADRAGEIAVVILVVAVTVAGIVVPIILLQ